MSKLTDEQIEAIYKQETGALIDDSPWALVDFSRAIESAATEPLLQRIAELELQLEEARNEAESYRWLKERDRWASVMVDFDRDGTYSRHRVVWYSKGEWLSSEGQSVEEAIAAAMQKGQS